MLGSIHAYRLRRLIFASRDGTLAQGQNQVRLTPTAAKILNALCENAPTPMSQPDLFKAACGLLRSREDCAGSVDNQIAALRKAAAGLGESEFIRNRRGFGYYIAVPCSPVEDEQDETVLLTDRLDGRALMAETLASREKDGLLVIEARRPLEARSEYRPFVWERLRAGVRTVVILGPDGAAVAARLLHSVLLGRMGEDASDVPPFVGVIGDGLLRAALRHLWMVLTPRVSTHPIYVLRAHDPFEARWYYYHVQRDRAWLFDEREAAQAHALERCAVLPLAQQSLRSDVDHPVLWCADGLSDRTLAVQEFQETLTHLSEGAAWCGEVGALLAYILPQPSKGVRKQGVSPGSAIGAVFPGA